MAFLERNLEQLTVVQRQLMEQNNSLKKEVAIAERKLVARNERIQSLESLLKDSQEKLTAANHRYVSLATIGIETLLIYYLGLKPSFPLSKSGSKLQRLVQRAVLGQLALGRGLLSAERLAVSRSHCVAAEGALLMYQLFQPFRACSNKK